MNILLLAPEVTFLSPKANIDDFLMCVIANKYMPVFLLISKLFWCHSCRLLVHIKILLDLPNIYYPIIVKLKYYHY